MRPDEEALAERAMDALVAERIMGWTRSGPDFRFYNNDAGFLDLEGKRRRAPHYSTDIAAAFEVLGKMAGWRIDFPAKMDGLGNPVSLYRVRLWAKNPNDYREWNGAGLPAVVCIAALGTVGL